MIINADILNWAESYDGPPFHALLCDPPYHLTEIVKRFGKPGSAPAQYGKDGAFNRLGKGFMGKTWDGGNIAFRPETWAALARHLHPGAFLFAFAGSRGYHRMACAIEDAGLIIHPAIGWAFGSGFPKATRLDTQIDRAAGADRQTVGTKKHQPKFAAAEFGYREKDNGYNSKDRESFDVTAPATDLAVAWQGHRYGLQAMKPAFEFICVAQKPYEGRAVESITRTGAGALWIDGARIGTDEDTARNRAPNRGAVGFGRGVEGMGGDGHPAGRWPANLALIHHPACERVGARRVKGSHDAGRSIDRSGQRNGYDGGWKAGVGSGHTAPDGMETIAAWDCHPDCPVRRLGEQSGELQSGYMKPGQPRNSDGGYHGNFPDTCTETGTYGDQGSAARFFHQSDWMAERLEASDLLAYFAKASRSDREAGLDPRQVALLELMEGFAQDTIDDGRKKPIDNPYQRGKTVRRNVHPTIKPISLTRWLATLLLPPDLYAPRRLLIPFAGAGSEMIGALLAGWEEIVGVELEETHVKIAEARMAYWQQRLGEFADPSKLITATLVEQPDDQLDMFEETL